MKHAHFQKDTDLLRALIVIQEDQRGVSEKSRQKLMSQNLSGKINEKEEDKEDEKSDKPDDSENKPDDSEDKSDSGETPDKKPDNKNQDKKKSSKLAGAKRLEDSELKPGEAPTSKDIAQRVNFIRAGASLKDKDISRKIAVWISQLQQPERLAAFTTLDALAQIVLGGKSPAEAPTFEDPAGLSIKATGSTKLSEPREDKPVAKAQPQRVQKSSGPVPITVGEGVVRKLKEVDVPVRSGKVVTFGSRSHISDLEQRIEDIQRIRSYQERGSDTYHSLGMALSSLKKLLATALKRGGGSENPRTQPVPPLVEKEK
jgi:hypothetical protein